MPRPRKWKKVCCAPEHVSYGILGEDKSNSALVLMSVEEYETIRLIDHENLSQDECAQRMDIARTTVQKLYSDARKKLALMVVDQAVIRIEGGDYKLYDDQDPMPRCNNPKHQGHGRGHRHHTNL